MVHTQGGDEESESDDHDGSNGETDRPDFDYGVDKPTGHSQEEILAMFPCAGHPDACLKPFCFACASHPDAMG